MELLAPAGSAEALSAAIKSGADAVYIGGKAFSARHSAQNFSNEEIIEAVKLCHLHDVKLHVAANILVKPRETDDFLEYMGFLNSAGVDAVIIQDIGMARVVHEAYPDLPIHASTQMTAASLSAVKYLEKAGFSRIVLARELSKSQISEICRGSMAEIEVFVHGAICMCYSGQCLMSSVIGARSGNRGLCAQPCRLPYEYEKNGKIIKKGYLLSPKDMSLIEHLDELANCGVTSLKLEGRLKNEEYVSCVTSCYRKYLDSRKKVTEEDKSLLKESFSRGGFTDGYFAGRIGGHMMSGRLPGNTGTGNTLDKKTDYKKRKLDIYCKLRKGEKLYIKMTEKNGFEAEAESDALVQEALYKPIGKERLTEQLSKLGASVFEAKKITIDIDADAIIPIKEINETRRRAVSALEEQILRKPERRSLSIPKTAHFSNSLPLTFTAQVKNAEQLRICENEGFEVIYIPYGLINEAKKADCRYAVILPEICDDGKIYDIPREFGVLISNIGQELLYPKHKKYGNSRLNIFNSCSAAVFDDYEAITLSPELNIKELCEISAKVPTEVIGYGKIPLMIMKNCPAKAIEGKCAKNSEAFLRDRMGEKFLLDCDGACHSMLLNSKNIYMADKLKDFEKTAVSRIRLVFHDEDGETTRNIIREYRDGLNGKNVKLPPENTYTRCHFYRGVQ